MTESMSDTPENASDRKSKTVTLTDRDIREAARLLSLLAGQENPMRDADALVVVEGQPAESRRVLLKKAREIFANRKRRTRYLNSTLFGEPAWDMLLGLYISSELGPRATVSRITEISGAAQSTALRRLAYLESEQFVRREPHPTDGRIVFVSLTEKAYEALEAYLSETLRAKSSI